MTFSIDIEDIVTTWVTGVLTIYFGVMIVASNYTLTDEVFIVVVPLLIGATALGSAWLARGVVDMVEDALRGRDSDE